jgi:hypothetical protein
MPNRTADTSDAHMWTYRDYLRGMNRFLAEEYIHQHSQHVFTAIEELAKAVPVALALAQLHKAIRGSPARNFWPVIRETKGVLLIRSTETDEECPWPWRRTKRGNMRYKLPGHLLFSPWLPNLPRRLRSCMTRLQRVADDIGALASKNDFSVTHLPYAIWYVMLGPSHLIPEIKSFQEFAMPDSIAALDRWSNEPLPDSRITLRISHGTLVYGDAQDDCEIEVPDALTRPLCTPSKAPMLELHLVRTGRRSYHP